VYVKSLIYILLWVLGLRVSDVFAGEVASTGPVRSQDVTIIGVDPSANTVEWLQATEKGNYIKQTGSISQHAALCSLKCGVETSDLRAGEKVTVRYMDTTKGPSVVSMRPVVFQDTVPINIVLKTVPGEADVFFNENQLGRSDKEGRLLRRVYWPQGQHKVRVWHPDYMSWEKRYKISENQHDINDEAVLVKK